MGRRFNELHGVWADGGDGPGSHARIELAALDGPLTLTHFDIGAYPHAQCNTIVDVYDLANTAPGRRARPLDAFRFRVRVERGLSHRLQNSAYNVGIDNITFTSAALIPEPGTYGLFIAGLALLGVVVNRRTRSRVAVF